MESKEREAHGVVFIIGGSGLVGSGLLEAARKNNYQIFAPTHDAFDIAGLSQREVIDCLRRERPGFVVLPAALTDVDWCENPGNRKIVWETNIKGAVTLAMGCFELGIPFGYISSDYVLSGDHYPHREGEEISPVNSVYAQSKAEAEKELIALGGEIHIIRIQRPFSDDLTIKRSDMIRDALRVNREGKPFYGITDQMITPIYTTDVAKAILNIMRSQMYGIWHVSSSKPVSPYEFVKMAFEELEGEGVAINWDLFREGKFRDFKDRWKAPRPRHTAFDVSKYEGSFGKMRGLREQVREWAGKIAINFKNAKI